MSEPLPNPLPQLIQDFFQQWLRAQRRLSQATLASYRDTVRLLLNFLTQKNGRPASQQRLEDLDAPLILEFLDHLETQRGNQIRTRNARLAAIHSLMRYCAQKEPEALAVSARVLAIPSKRFERPLLGYLGLRPPGSPRHPPSSQRPDLERSPGPAALCPALLHRGSHFRNGGAQPTGYQLAEWRLDLFARQGSQRTSNPFAQKRGLATQRVAQGPTRATAGSGFYQSSRPTPNPLRCQTPAPVGDPTSPPKLSLLEGSGHLTSYLSPHLRHAPLARRH